MKVFGHPMSTCTRKVLCTLAEKGQAAEFVMVDILKGEQKQPAYLARHPFGVVPAIDDDGYNLYESRAIMRYLDARLPGTALTPTDLRGRGLMEQWMSVEGSYFTPPAMKIIFQTVFHPLMGKPTDAAVVETARVELARTVEVMEATLSKQPYLAGDNFSLADICFLPYVQYLFDGKQGDFFTARPGTRDWWQRVSSRPSWQKTIGR